MKQSINQSILHWSI